jgi:DNA-binding NtrC family response regulator
MPKSRILVIDDEAAIRESLKMTLEYEGYEFIGAATGQEGLTLAEREAPDLVLLDVKMPGMDGLEVLDRLRNMNDALPIVVISGHGTISTAVEATKKRRVRFHREAVRERSRAGEFAECARPAATARRKPHAEEGG